MQNGLLGSTVLEVVIGLIFVYLLLAIFFTTANEWIAGILNTRSTTLKTAITQLLDGQTGQANADVNWFLNQFQAHPLIAGIRQPGKKDPHPSYVSARAFATVVMDIATPQAPGAITFDDLEAGINNLPQGDVKKALLALIQNAHRDIQQAQKNIEGWFNDTMERVSGWYKRRTQVWTVLIAIVLTLCANADTLQIVKTLWTDPTLRAELVEQAGQRTAAQQDSHPIATTVAPGTQGSQPIAPTAGAPATPEASPATAANYSRPSQNELASLGHVLGWSWQSLPASGGQWLDRIFGWLLSIIAISLGAPFWFDLLNRFMRIRSSGESPQETTSAAQRPRA
jgi:hypothetical protein